MGTTGTHLAKSESNFVPSPGFSKLPAVLLAAVQLVFLGVLGYLLASSELLPGTFLWIILLLLILVVAGVTALTWNPRNHIRFALGIVLNLLLAAVLLYGCKALSQALTTLNDITQVTTQTAEVNIYVRQEDAAQSLSDAENYTFGILQDLDRDNTDEVLSQVRETLGHGVTTMEYTGVLELTDALLDGQVDAIVLNAAYIEMIVDAEGYEDTQDKIRVISDHVVVTEVVPTAVTGTEETAAEDGTFVLYISGIDSREGLVSKSRSDVNILAVVNTSTRQVLLVSTPRDYYVPLSISNGVRDKLTHAGIYGVEVSMATLGMLYDVNVDYYFRVNFGGFEDIVDALGGVTVYSEYSFTTYDGNYSFSAGDNTLNGAQALGFARERKAFITGDRQRGVNQMALIKAIVNKVLSPSILANYSSLLESVQGNFETSVPMSVLSKLVRDQLSDGGSWNIVTYSVDGTGDSQIPYSLSTYSYVMWPDEDTVATAKDLISQVLNGETVTAP
jgi:LCP family protein required for cell wall assembly